MNAEARDINNIDDFFTYSNYALDLIEALYQGVSITLIARNVSHLRGAETIEHCAMLGDYDLEEVHACMGRALADLKYDSRVDGSIVGNKLSTESGN